MIEFYIEFLKEWWEFHDNYKVKINDYEPSIEAVGELAKQNNAILSIAHPNITFRKEWIDHFNKVLPDYIEKGINAIEINSTATTKWLEIIYQAKKKFNLLVTAWSDNHAIWKTDDVHWDFWSINPLLSDKQRENIIREYRDYLIK